MAGIDIAEVSFANLDSMDDGRLAALLKRHLASIANDCMNRPGDETARTLSIEFKIKPVMDSETRECEKVWCEIEMKHKLPTFRSKPYQMVPTKAGFGFNRDFPDNLRAQPLPGLED